MSLAEDVTFQSTGSGGQTVILCLSSGYLYTCNETSASFLAAIDGKRTFGQVVDALLEQYDVAREKLRPDLEALTEKMAAEKILRVG